MPLKVISIVERSVSTVSGAVSSVAVSVSAVSGATSSEGSVDELMLAGGCSLTPNLLETLRERFGLPTELMNPFRRVFVKDGDFDSSWIQSVAPMLAVSVGLAVRKIGD